MSHLTQHDTDFFEEMSNLHVSASPTVISNMAKGSLSSTPPRPVAHAGKACVTTKGPQLSLAEVAKPSQGTSSPSTMHSTGNAHSGFSLPSRQNQLPACTSAKPPLSRVASLQTAKAASSCHSLVDVAKHQPPSQTAEATDVAKHQGPVGQFSLAKLATEHEGPAANKLSLVDLAKQHERPAGNKISLAHLAKQHEGPAGNTISLAHLAKQHEGPAGNKMSLAHLAKQHEGPAGNAISLAHLAKQHEGPAGNKLSMADLAKQHEGPAENTISLAHLAKQYEGPAGNKMSLAHLAKQREGPAGSTISLAHLAKQHEGPAGNKLSVADLAKQHEGPAGNEMSLAHLAKQHEGPAGNKMSLAHLAKQHEGPAGNKMSLAHLAKQHQGPAGNKMSLAHLAKQHQGPQMDKVLSTDLAKQRQGPRDDKFSIADLAKQHLEAKGLVLEGDSAAGGLCTNGRYNNGQESSGAPLFDSAELKDMAELGMNSRSSLADLARQHSEYRPTNKPTAVKLAIAGPPELQPPVAEVFLPTNHITVPSTPPGDGLMSLTGASPTKPPLPGFVAPHSVPPATLATCPTSSAIGQHKTIPAFGVHMAKPSPGKPSLFAQVFCTTQHGHRQPTAKLSYPRFSYHRQVSSGVSVSVVAEGIIKPFNFLTPSPDDIVKEKQKAAFSRTGECKYRL